MNSEPTPADKSTVIVFLFGAIFNLLANMDWPGLIDYGLKALLGGAIWMAFKVISDIIFEKLKKRKKQ